MVNHTFNTTSTERLQQHSFLFRANCTDRTFFLWRLYLAWPSHHHGHSTILLRSESQSGKCAKLHTMAASNNRDYHPTRSLIACLCHIRVGRYVGYSSRTSRSGWIAHSTQRKPRGCNNTWISAWSLSHGLALNLNQKSQLKISTRNINPKPQPKT